jgi:hypothetical protein
LLAATLQSRHPPLPPVNPQIDPSGSYFAWKASAIGKNMNNAKTFLEKRYSDEVGLGGLGGSIVVEAAGCGGGSSVWWGQQGGGSSRAEGAAG